MRDRIYMVLAFVGFVILAIVTMHNYDGGQDEKTFAVGDFYTPLTVKSRVDSSVDLWNQMSGKRGLSCPQEYLEQTTESKKVLTSIGNANSRNKYGALYMFVSCNTMSKNKDGTTNPNIKFLFYGTTDKNNVASQMNTGCDVSKADTYKMGDLWGIDNNAVELIAPFDFTFESVNSENPDKIVIVNSDNSCKITFDKVVNWFCAGKPNSDGITVGTGTTNNKVSWKDHGKADASVIAEPSTSANGSTTESTEASTEGNKKLDASHLTVVGNTSNAKITGGNSGDVIGYANKDTTVLIQKNDTGNIETISLADFICGQN